MDQILPVHVTSENHTDLIRKHKKNILYILLINRFTDADYIILKSDEGTELYAIYL